MIKEIDGEGPKHTIFLDSFQKCSYGPQVPFMSKKQCLLASLKRLHRN